MAHPVLWHFPGSHFNEKVRWALDFKGIPHVRRALAFSYVPRALWRTGQARLPVLILDGRAICDSTHIIAALERFRPDPPLYPRDDSARRRALMLEEFFDEEVGPQASAFFIHELFTRTPDLALDFFALGHGTGHRRAMRVMFPLFQALYRRRHNVSAATAREGRGRVLAALDRIEAERQPSGYLVGGEFTVADLTAAALLGSFAAAPTHLQYPLPRPAWVVEFHDSLAGRVASQWLAEMYERHRGRSAEVAA